MPLPAPTPHPQLPALRGELERLGFTVRELGPLLGMRAESQPLDYLAAASVPTLVRLPTAPSPREILAHVFLASGQYPAAELETLFSADAWAALRESGLVCVADGQARASCVLLPWRKLWIACGLREERYDEDYVFFPDRSTFVATAYLTPIGDEPRARALDVGTGSGILAFLLATRHGFARVRAVDINPRALAFARFGAALNGLDDRVEVAAMDPADPQPFGEPPGSADLVSFVLPQIYTVPIGRAIASHAGEGERLLHDTYRNLARVLSPGGRAVLYHQVLRASGLDLPAILAQADVPDLHVTWRPTPATYYGAAEFGVALVRRRRPGEPQLTKVAVPGRGLLLAREAIAEHLAGCALLADGFEQATPRLVEGAVSVLLRVDAAGIGDTGQLELAGVRLPTAILPLLRACNGQRTVAAVVATQASREEALQAIRALVEMGLVTLRAR